MKRKHKKKWLRMKDSRTEYKVPTWVHAIGGEVPIYLGSGSKFSPPVSNWAAIRLGVLRDQKTVRLG